MKDKTFEGRAGLARAAHLAIGPKLRRAAFVFAALLPLGGAMTACTPEKEPVFEMGEQSKLVIIAPDGAIPPPGMDRIELGMKRDQVLKLLAPIYEIVPSAAASDDYPTADYFKYERDGDIFYGEIYYNDIFVSEVRYGYASTQKLY